MMRFLKLQLWKRKAEGLEIVITISKGCLRQKWNNKKIYKVIIKEISMADESTREAILKDALEIRAQIQEGGVLSVGSEKTLFDGALRIAARLHYLAEIGERETFRQLVDACIDYTTRANQNMTPEEVRMETLDYLEHLCFCGDRGYMTIGLGYPPAPMGKAHSLLLELYKGQMPHDKGYKVQHRTKIFASQDPTTPQS